MLYEFIATISAGFALAGIALIIQHLSKLIFKIKTPKWLTPLFAAIGIFSFQIQQEYNWFNQTVNKLPETTKVINSIKESSWYRPWTYVKPHTIRFMAVDTAHIIVNENNPNLKLINIDLYERRISTKKISQILDCKNNRRADFATTATIKDSNLDNLPWLDLKKTDKLLTAVCK